MRPPILPTPALRVVIRPAIVAAALAGAAALRPAPADAQLFQQPVVYTRTGQSLWGGAASASSSWSFTESWNRSTKIGGIAGSAREVIVPGGCVLGICVDDQTADTRTGSEFRAYTSGHVKLDASARFSQGTFDVTYHANAGVEVVSGLRTYLPGDKLTLNSVWTPTSGSSLRTTAPTFEARATLDLGLTAGTTAKACFFGAGCSTSGGDFLSFDTPTFDLASVRWGGTSAVKLVDVTVPQSAVGVPISPGDIRFGATQAVDMTIHGGDVSAQAWGAGTVTTHAEGDLLGFDMDPVKLALDVSVRNGACLVDCSRYGFGYDLAGNRFGPLVGLDQQLELAPGSEQVTYEFSTPVRWKRSPFWGAEPRVVPCGEITWLPLACLFGKQYRITTWGLIRDAWSADAVTSVTLPVGRQLDVMYPETGGEGLTVTTRFAATAQVHNTSRLQVSPRYDFSLLRATTPGGSLGPVYRRSFGFGAELDLAPFFDQLFDVDLGSADGATVFVSAGTPGGPVGGFLPGESDPPRPQDLLEPIVEPEVVTPEPAPLALCAAGLAALVGARVRRRRG